MPPFYEFGGGNRATGVLAGISQPFLRGVAPAYVLNTLDAAKSQEKVAGLSQIQSACACRAGAIPVQFDVFRSGIKVQSSPSSSLCGSTTQSFSYTY